jgi:hypothetical protein
VFDTQVEFLSFGKLEMWAFILSKANSILSEKHCAIPSFF